MNANPFYYYTDLTDERLYLNEFAKILRDLADKDYIASRSLYRRDNLVHAAYLAHQSVEKYFKAVLLYLGKNTRKYKHDIKKLYKTLNENGVFLNDRSVSLLNHLDGFHNVTRYRSGNFYVLYSFLFDLDYFVRDIRPHVCGRCIDKAEWIPRNPYRIMSGHNRKSGSLITNGFLEKTLKSKRATEAKIKEDLIWNNDYFFVGQVQKGRRIQGSYSSNLPFDLANLNDIKMAKLVSKYFQFEPEIEEALKKSLIGEI